MKYVVPTAALSLAALGWTEQALAIPAVALTSDNNLHTFDTASPGTLRGAVPISGLQMNETMLGIDFRPATGQLFGVGSTSRVYSIDVSTGVATAVGAAFTPALDATDIGIDFNPTVDRIRVVTTADQNLRLNPITGAVAATDTRLIFAQGDPNAMANPAIAASAYTNNYGGATATVLYNIDANLDVLVTQVPPNNGTLNTVGALGINAASVSGFDISGGNGGAFAVITVQGNNMPGLYSINLGTGAATALGTFANANVRDVSIVPGGALAFSAASYSAAEDSGMLSVTVNRVGGTAGVLTVDYATSDGTAVAPGDYTATSGTLTFADGVDTAQTIQIPLTRELLIEGTETATITLRNLVGRGDLGRRFATLRIVNDDNVTLWGLTGDNRLITFEDDAPGVITATVTITGLPMGEALHGIDFRPATGMLYTVSSASVIYAIDPITGAATAAGPAFTPALDGTDFGVDFNPTVDRLRVVSNTGQNLRLNPITGAAAATDTPLAYAMGDRNAAATPHVVAAAYTNNFVGAGSTTLYDIDSALDVLVTQVPPNNGTLNTIGGLGVDVGAVVGFDITTGDTALAVMTPTGGAQSLYTIDLATGRAILVGAVGSRAPLRGFAIATGGGFQLGAPTYTVSEAGGMLTVSITRTGGTSGPASVSYTTSARSATADLDYVDTTGTLMFGHMDASRTVDITILQDMAVEGDETFVIRLSGASMGARVGAVNTATITITDDDMMVVDAGVVDSGDDDSGVVADSGVIAPAPDSGVIAPAPDAGTAARPDATAAAPDSGVVEEVDGGCGCSTGSPSGSGLMALLVIGAMLGLRRRRS